MPLSKINGLLAVSAAVIFLAGCENGQLALSNEARESIKSTAEKQGEARLAIFTHCMELAAKMPRQADDDVSDIVNECGDQSAYMTNYIR